VSIVVSVIEVTMCGIFLWSCSLVLSMSKTYLSVSSSLKIRNLRHNHKRIALPSEAGGRVRDGWKIIAVCFIDIRPRPVPWSCPTMLEGFPFRFRPRREGERERAREGRPCLSSSTSRLSSPLHACLDMLDRRAPMASTVVSCAMKRVSFLDGPTPCSRHKCRRR
jgi:hypothetical protein